MKLSHRLRLGARALCRLTGICAVVVLAACRTPPDVSLFAEATEALQVVVSSTGRQVRGELQQRAEASGSQANDWAALQARFDEAWSHRIAAMEALGDYATGMVEVVEAGGSAEANARQVVSRARALVTNFTAAYPAGAPTVNQLTDALVKVYGAWAEDRAARTVAEAIAYVNPAVADMAGILASDLAALTTLVEDYRRSELLAADAQYQTNDLRDLAALRSIEQERAQARAALATASDADSERLAELSKTLEAWNRLHQQEVGSPWHTEWVARRREINAKHNRYRALLLTASATVQAWGDAHEKLARVAQTGQSPSFAVLTQLATELLESYAEVRNGD